ncbi:aspartate phosphatase [Shouchella sp. 1P09AA]|uniref:response regulator aspartate phosphatase n=1 Tax=unclassified Shouchella TaxID=2893065 RepID=UPI0039A22C24
MQETLTPEEVGAKIVEWYSCIISASYEQAILLKEEARHYVVHMEKNDKILAYYSLVEFRHNMFVDEFNKKHELGDTFHFVETEVDRYLKYLYYFVSGQYEYTQERYRSAIKLFRKAERLLEHVNDDAEESEFYLYIGLVYYRLNQYLMASSYLEQAATIFNRLKYYERALNCRQVLGAIRSELHEFETGDAILQEAFKESTFPRTSALILRTLGLSKFRQKDYEAAKSYFYQALEYEEHQNHQIGMKTKYDLSNTLFKLGEQEQALALFSDAQAGANAYNNKEYKARCLFLDGLYIEQDVSLVDESLTQLTRHGLWFEVCELAEEMVDLADQQQDESTSLKYYRIAYQAKANQNRLGADQV